MGNKIKIGNREFEWGKRTYVMGIINMTPDSFSGDGLFEKEGAVLRATQQAEHFVNSGVDILDVGGESTRPGAKPVSAPQEQDRVLPVIEVLVKEFNVPISIDTYRSSTAKLALDLGADVVNDVWGLHADPSLAALVAECDVPVILMHNRSTPGNAEVRDQLGGRYVGMEYENLLEDVKRELLESVEIAKKGGIPDEHIILDPGVGFGKTVKQNLELINHADIFRLLGYPVLIGPSRKSFIGYSLDLPPDQRVEGTAAAVAVSIVRGADIVRVHDVEMMVRVARMTDAIVR
jgi:dihydropteroate synthase